MVYNILIHMWLVLNFVTTTFGLYHLSIALAAFRKPKDSPINNLKYHRFAAVIAARNEENVIVKLIESIQQQNYPHGLIDIFVIADNCDDRTAEVSKKAGAFVYKRFNKAEIGKGYVVKFAFEKIIEENDIYDAFCILDADNVADKNFFMQMNNALCRGANIAQGYRDMKNPVDSWISGCHSIFFWMENRFYNFARNYLGLSATLNGTAFMVRSSLIKQIGFDVSTVTEDIEYTMRCVLNGFKIDWVPEAIVYDEQPVTVAQSMRQRTRWANGFIQNALKYFKVLSVSFFKRPTWIKWDTLMFLFSLPIMFLGAGSSLLYAILGVLMIFDPVSTLTNFAMLCLGSMCVFWVIAILSVIFEKKNVKDMLPAILTYPLFNLMWVLIYCQCLFKRDLEWKPIIHIRNIGIDEIESSRTGK